MTCNDLDSLKKKPMAVLLPVLKAAYWWQGFETSVVPWRRKSTLDRFAKANPDISVEAADALLDWAFNNAKELEIFIASRSPSSAATIAVSHNRRLCPEAEKKVTEKAKHKATLLSYCGKFGIVLDDMSKITLKASFEDKSWREKNYIKKIEDTKKQLKDFLSQMVCIGQIDPNQTVQDLIQNLC
jgi:hypothetical protein